MSALARYFLAQKWAVSGSDLTESSITKELRKEGVEVKIGQEKGNINPGAEKIFIPEKISGHDGRGKHCGDDRSAVIIAYKIDSYV